MHITTLGTSHGDATYCRFNSSTLYETGGNLYLIDCGEPVAALLTRAGKDFSRVKAVFVTHMHVDHTGGLDCLLLALTKYARRDGSQHTRIYLPEEGAAEGLLAWLGAVHQTVPTELISFHVIRPDGDFYDDGMLRARAIPNGHMEAAGAPSYCFHLEAEGKTVLHTGDLRSDFSDFPAEAQTTDYDLCVCEATHYPPETAVPALRTARLRRLWFTHVHNPWHGPMGEAEFLKPFACLPYPVAIAHDGDELDLWKKYPNP